MTLDATAPGSVDDYIAGFAPEVRRLLEAMRRAIRAAAPEASEKLCYRMPTFYLNGNLVHFAAFKRHIGFYPGASAIAAFRDELNGWHTSKGAIRFPFGEPLPLALVQKIVRYRVQENSARAPRRKSRRKVKSGWPAQLEQIPNIGPSIAADLRELGIQSPEQLAACDPLATYLALAGPMGARHDPCVLYTFLAAHHFLTSDEAVPWWKFTAQGKVLLGRHT